jgi:hypothetical protein
MIFSIEHWQNLGVATSRLIGVFGNVSVHFLRRKTVFRRDSMAFWRKLTLTIVPAAGLTAFAEYQIYQRFDADLIYAARRGNGGHDYLRFGIMERQSF